MTASEKQHLMEAKEAERLAERAKERPSGLLSEYWEFLRREQKWWILPILINLFVIGGLVALGTTAIAPIIYTMF